jgi:hypothetical protein
MGLGVLAVSLTLLKASSPGGTSPALHGFGWLAGRWVETSSQGVSEETWTPPEGDSIMGMWRLVSEGRTKVFELTTITVEEGGAIVLRVRHFTDRNTVARETGGPLTLTLVRQAENRAVFEGVEKGAKVRVTYALTASGSLSFVLEMPSGGQQFLFEKAKPAP